MEDCPTSTAVTFGAGIPCFWLERAGLVIERLQVRIPAGAAEEFSSPELTLCADSYSVSVPPYDQAITISTVSFQLLIILLPNLV